jgi:hypothetical protein
MSYPRGIITPTAARITTGREKAKDEKMKYGFKKTYQFLKASVGSLHSPCYVMFKLCSPLKSASKV